jgi:antitoxin VapB
MGAIETKTFKSGNSVAVRLPKELGFETDMAVTIERHGDVITIRPTHDAAEKKRKLLEFIEVMRALPAPGYIEKREPIEFPERPGL